MRLTTHLPDLPGEELNADGVGATLSPDGSLLCLQAQQFAV
jgi:hypothetical protein